MKFNIQNRLLEIDEKRNTMLRKKRGILKTAEKGTGLFRQ